MLEWWSGGSGLPPRNGLCCHMLKVGLVLRPREGALRKKDATEAKDEAAGEHLKTRYAGAIRTWRSTPILQHSNTPSLHHSITPSLRAAGFEDEDDEEDSLPDVAFCARGLAVLSASEVGRTKCLVRTELPESCGKPVAPSAGRARLHPVCGRRIEAVS